MSPLTILAPTDAQLQLIAKLVREQGWQPPQTVASKAEASEIIDAMLGSIYDPGRYVYPFVDTYDDVPFR